MEKEQILRGYEKRAGRRGHLQYDDDDDDDDDDIELLNSNCSYDKLLQLDHATHHWPLSTKDSSNTRNSPFYYPRNSTTTIATTRDEDQPFNEDDDDDDDNNDKPSPLPVTFVEFVTVPPPDGTAQHAAAAANANPVWSPSRGPFRLLPRCKGAFEKVVLSSGAGGNGSSSAGGGSSIMSGSPVRPRKRSVWTMSTGFETAAVAATRTAAETDVPVSPSTGLKQHLHRLSIHSPATGSLGEEGPYFYHHDGFFQRSSTPQSFAKTATTTPPTLEGSPSSCFSKVVVNTTMTTNTSTIATGPVRHHYQRQSNHSTGNATLTMSPRIVPLTVLTHDPDTDDSKLPPVLRYTPGQGTTARYQTNRIFSPQRSPPPHIRTVWSWDDDNNIRDSDHHPHASPHMPPSPHSATSLSWRSHCNSPGSRRRALPKISLTPRSLAKRSPVIPRFPFQGEDDDTINNDNNDTSRHTSSEEPITLASFQRLKPSGIGESIFGPPGPHEVNSSFLLLQQESIGQPDMESLSDNDEDDKFLLAFPSTLAEEKLQQRRNVKARRNNEDMLGDKTRSMASMASSSCASLRGIAFASSDPDLVSHGLCTTSDPAPSNDQQQHQHQQQQQQDSHIGWVFDADDHIPARDLVTPPIPSTSADSPPLLSLNDRAATNVANNPSDERSLSMNSPKAPQHRLA